MSNLASATAARAGLANEADDAAAAGAGVAVEVAVDFLSAMMWTKSETRETSGGLSLIFFTQPHN